MFVTTSENRKKVKIGTSKAYQIVQYENDIIRIGSTLESLVQKTDALNYLFDLCNYSIQTLSNQGESYIKNDFILNQRYTRKDVFRILNWDENPVAQNVGGYMISKDKKNCAIFVNYHKEDDISATTKYHDRFLSRNEFIWMSKSKRKLNSPDVQSILQQSKYGMRIPLFIKKSNIEGSDFYYLGNITIIENYAAEKNIPDDKGNQISVVEMGFYLEHPVEKSLYDYIISSD